MLNVVNSPLAERFRFLKFSTSRPPKKNTANNYGYQSLLQGGIGRLLLGISITFWNIFIFPATVILGRANIVQVQSSDFQTFWEAALYIILCRILRRPSLMRLGGSFDHFYRVSSPLARRLIRGALQLPDRLIVQSDYWREFVQQLGRTKGIVVIPNWVSDDLVEPVIRPERVSPVCLFVAGSEAVRKGIDEIFEAINRLQAAGTNIQFWLVAMPPNLVARLEREGLSNVTEVRGYIQHDQLLCMMRRADIFLLPSRGEGFPNSLIEAMALKMACVVTPVGAVPEIVGVKGAELVPVRDGSALANAIQRLVEHKHLRDQFAENGHAIVKEQYVASAILPMLERAWQSMMK